MPLGTDRDGEDEEADEGGDEPTAPPGLAVQATSSAKTQLAARLLDPGLAFVDLLKPT